MDEFNEQTVPVENIAAEWDYVTLGHYHEHKKLGKRAYYSGSTERLSFSEAGQKKGIVEADLATGTVKFHQLKVRDMLDLEAIDASNMTSSEILRAARDLVSKSAVDEKIVRLVIRKVASDAYTSLNLPDMRRLGSAALHFELKIDKEEAEGERQVGETQIGLLADEFRKYVATLNLSELHDALSRIGFRRSQTVAYRPSCIDCRACVSVRVVAGEFAPSDTQRRTMRAHAGLHGSQCRPWATPEQFALLQISADWHLEDLVEKPDAASFARLSSPPYVSMNSWTFDARIFEACARVPRSERGEFELPQAVRFAIHELGARVRVIPFDLPVRDLSRRRDIATVTSHLAAVTPDP